MIFYFLICLRACLSVCLWPAYLFLPCSHSIDPVLHNWSFSRFYLTFRETRRLVEPYISDPDMLREEQPKRELSLYHSVYQTQRDDRVFLNGPDVAAFYQPVPEALFVELADLDPAFGEQFDWEVKGWNEVIYLFIFYFLFNL